MMTIPKALLALVLCALCAESAVSQSPAIRLVSRPDAATAHLPSVLGIRVLSNGSVLVDDARSRQILLFDSSLTAARAIVDSGPASRVRYGSGPLGLIPGVLDTTLVVDPVAASILVLAGDGVVARTVAVPRVQDAMLLAFGAAGPPALDRNAFLVYRALPSGNPAAAIMRNLTGPPPSDSVPLFRVSLATRRVDTVAFVRVVAPKISVVREDKHVSITSTIDPLPNVDDWALMPDGTVALIRGAQFRIDWLDTTGAVNRSPRIQFDWQHLSDEDKARFVDSTQQAARRPADGSSPDLRVMMKSAGISFTTEIIAADQLPDYRPAVIAGGARSDPQGRLWVRTSYSRPGVHGPVYYVIDRSGKVVDRVEVPVGRSIAAFGGSGSIFLIARDGPSAWVERVH